MTGKQDKPLGLDMDPDEALARFICVDPDELPEHVRLRQKKGHHDGGPMIDKKPAKGV